MTSSTVTVTVPALCAGQRSVSVTAGNSTSNALPFFLVPAPVVTAP
ncbi:hypothetical protein [Streptomyces coffeae]|uniref:Uncharacterized protein n=1 Tax=Streptomyces coffeae TaxID=621382 RepID=A0ABS1NAF7_9ACTN|nr:hypothetical protein [Streptomyces coffeae]MBL1097063.1 hypothetical protein [Streptomyces coffeae]